MRDVAVEVGLRRRRVDAGAELDRVLTGDLVEPVYQPIVDLATGWVAAYEALARGPRGSLLEMPGALFGAAARHGRLEELDWVCRSAAIRGAFGADYLPPAALFVNVEPVAAGQQIPVQYESLMARAQDGLRVVFEFTERSLTDHPREVLYAVRALRELGAMIALDDVGVDPRSLALLPFLEPEVVKLDMSLVHDPNTPHALDTYCGVTAFTEQTGALLIAEGIETQDHLQTAQALGASHGQGWLFGRPGPLPAADSWQPVEVFGTRPRTPIDASQTPFDWLAANSAPSGRATHDALLSLWRHLLASADALGSAAVVLAAPGSLTGGAALRGMEELAGKCAFAGALEVLPVAPVLSGVRTGTLDAHEPLAQESCLSVLAPHYAATLAARPLPGTSNLYDFRLSHDRPAAACAARRLMARIAPEAVRSS